MCRLLGPNGLEPHKNDLGALKTALFFARIEALVEVCEQLPERQEVSFHPWWVDILSQCSNDLPRDIGTKVFDSRVLALFVPTGKLNWAGKELHEVLQSFHHRGENGS